MLTLVEMGNVLLIEAYMVVARPHRGVQDAAQVDVVIQGCKADTVCWC